MRIVVIGGGMAGVLATIKLREHGYRDITVYEKADRLGGTWRENTYPGIACDVPSYLYCYSFAPNPDWSHVYSPGHEILAYFEAVAAEHGVTEHVRLSTEVSALRWRDGGWDIELSTGERDRADAVIAATGVLHHPNIPAIEGLDRFAGPCFHTARWDHDVDIAGKRVGVIGTGSSAVQIVSAITKDVAELRLFQRTAQWILPLENPPVDPEEQARLRVDRDALTELRAHYAETFETRFANAVVDADSPVLAVIQQLVQANLEDNVRDPELREQLRPDHRAACKRLIVSPTFYDAIQQPNARLVTEAIECVEPRGVVTRDGVLHELDVLVLATGFRVDRFLRPIEVTGRDGVTLDELWAERPAAYLCVTVPHLPNLFLLNGPNGPVGNFSLIDVADLQMGYVLPLLDLLRDREQHEISPRPEALARFDEDRTEAARHTVWATGCKSWYLDDRGIPMAWPWTFTRFREAMAAPDLAAFDLR